MGSFKEGLGRVMVVAGALEYERPFFGPLYKFLILHQRESIRAVPPHVSFFLRYLSDQIAQCRHHDCSSRLFPDQLAPTVDAQASAERTGVGGWFPHVDESGKVNVAASRSLEMDGFGFSRRARNQHSLSLRSKLLLC